MTTSDLPTDPVLTDGDDDRGRGGAFAPPWLTIALAVFAAITVVARFFQPSALWGTEAINVTLGRLPLRQLRTALVHSGGPPGWIAVLHVWERLFGTGVTAVRALPGIITIATLPVLALMGRRLAGRRGVTDFAFVASLSPYLLFAGSDAGPAAFVVFLCACGALAILAGIERPSAVRLVGVAISAAALVWTHYLSVAVVGSAAVALLAARRTRDGSDRRAVTATLVALTLGTATLALWAPVLRDQLSTAGTPWGERVRPATIVTTSVMALNGGPSLLLLLTIPLLVIGVFGLRQNGPIIRLDLQGRPDAAGVAAVLVGGFVVAAVLTLVTGATFTSSDAPAFFVPYMALVALGLCRLTGSTRSVVLAAVAIVSAFVLVTTFNDPRTQVNPALAAIQRVAHGAGLVVACPPQVGPSLQRAAPRRVQVVRYPDLRPATTVDWVDFNTRMSGADAALVAEHARQIAAGRPVFVVIGRGYRGGAACNGLVAALGARSGGRVILEAQVDEYQESMRVYAFDPA